MIEYVALILAGLTIFSAGLLKGVVGVGAPLVSLPLLAAIYDVPTAISVMVIPLIVSNAWQMWVYRQARQDRNTLVLLLAGCAVGVVIGTALLEIAPGSWLSIVLAAVVFGYVGLNLVRPDISVSSKAALRAAAPIGLVSGVLQGAAGLSTPVSVTFIHAQRLRREAFLFSTQTMFTVLTVTQILALSAFGIMTWRLAAASVAALVPMMIGIRIGQYIGSFASQRTFERLTLGVLVLVAVGLLAKALPEIFA